MRFEAAVGREGDMWVGEVLLPFTDDEVRLQDRPEGSLTFVKRRAGQPGRGPRRRRRAREG